MIFPMKMLITFSNGQICGGGGRYKRGVCGVWGGGGGGGDLVDYENI